MRKECRWATGLMVLSISAFLVACENDRPRASKAGSSDANKAFAEYAARANASPTASPGMFLLADAMDFPVQEAHLAALAKAAFSVGCSIALTKDTCSIRRCRDG